MENASWLTLTDFASKYRVSVSTLRRKIKTGQIKHRLHEGKYVVPDDPTTVGYEEDVRLEHPSSSDHLVQELKRAYMNILHEKEEQIIALKAEVTDLKTLVRALEDDNLRMRRFLTSPEMSRV